MASGVVKELNTKGGEKRFRYQSFNDRIQNVKIEFIQKRSEIQDLPQDSDSFLADSLSKWKDLDCTALFKSLSRSLIPLCQTLPQILYHQSNIFNLITSYLVNPDFISHEAALELLTAFVKDLQAEFLPFFETALLELTKLFDNQDVKVIEQVFQTIALLYKYLSRHHTRNLIPIYNIVESHLYHSKKYVRSFSAEAFAFLIRKAKKEQVEEIIIYILQRATELENIVYQNTLVLLFVHSMKHIRNSLHSKSYLIFQALIHGVGKVENSESVFEIRPAYYIVKETLIQISNHCLVENISPLWEVLLESINLDKEFPLRLSMDISLLSTLVAFRKGQRVINMERLYCITSDLIKLNGTSSLPSSVNQQVLRLAISLVSISGLEAVLKYGRNLFQLIFANEDEKNISFFILSLARLNFKHFEEFILPFISGFILNGWKRNPQYIFQILCSFFKSQFWIERKRKQQLSIDEAFHEFLLHQLMETINLESELLVYNSPEWKKDLKENSTLLRHSMTILCLTNSKFDNHKSLKMLIHYLDRLLKLPLIKPDIVDGILNGNLCSLVSILINQTMSAIQTISDEMENKYEFMNETWDLFMKAVRFFYNEDGILTSFANYANLLADGGQIKSEFHLVQEPSLFQNLRRNLRSSNVTLRKKSLEILLIFSRNCDISKSELFEECLRVELIEPNVQNHRERMVLFNQLARKVYETTTGDVVEYFINFCVGQLKINFLSLKKPTVDVMVKLADQYPALFWNIVEPEISESINEYSAVLNIGSDLDKFLTKTQDQSNQTTEFYVCKYSMELLGTIYEELDNCNGASLGHTLSYLAQITTKETARFDHNDFLQHLLDGILSSPKLMGDHAEYFTEGFLKLVSTHGIGGLRPLPLPETIHFPSKWNICEKWDRNKCRIRTIFHLKFYKSMKRIQRLSHSKLLFDIFLRMLCSVEGEIQSLAMDCLLAFKMEILMKHAETLKNLCQEDSFRDMLSTLALEGENAFLLSTERKDIVPILLRILYGKMLSKKGNSSAKFGVKARRNAILLFLSGCNTDELSFFIDLILESFKKVRVLESYNANGEFEISDCFKGTFLPPTQVQLAFLNVLEDFIKQLPHCLNPFIADIFQVLAYILHNAYHPSDHNDLDEIKKLKEIKLQGVKRMAEMFQLENTDFSPFISALFKSFLSDRINSLTSECITTPSIFLEIFSNWSINESTASFLTDYNSRIIPQVLGCIAHPKAHFSVAVKVIGLLENIVALDEESEEKAHTRTLLAPHLSLLMDSCQNWLTLPTSSDNHISQKYGVIKRQITLFTQLVQFVKDPEQAKQLLGILFPMLKIPAKFFSDISKEEILRIFLSFIPLLETVASTDFMSNVLYKTLSSLLSQLRERRCRQTLIDCFVKLAEIHKELIPISEFLIEVNSYSVKRLDDPDYERRIKAFVQFNDHDYCKISGYQWLPFLHAFIFLCNDDDEIAMRTNASFGITRFVQVAKAGDVYAKDILHQTLLPVIRRSIKSKSFHTRREYLQILSLLVETFPEDESFSDMVCLIGQDEEVNFFYNIHHIQVHRRIRAMLRFCKTITEGFSFKQKTLSTIFMPIFLQFLRDDTTDSNVTSETCKTLGVLSNYLKWREYQQLVNILFSLVKKCPEKEKLLILAISSVFNGFHFNVNKPDIMMDAEICDNPAVVKNNDPMDIEESEEVLEPIIDQTEKVEVINAADNKDGYNNKAYEVLKKMYIPRLHGFLQDLDDDTLKRRITLAVTIVRLLKLMPEQDLIAELPKVLIATCQFLRHRMEGVRNAIRLSLGQIVTLLGPRFFNYIVREMSVALTKGYQLHVLSYTIYELLQKLSKDINGGDLDNSIPLLVDILMRDIFGSAGEEKEATEFGKKIPEAKVCKSFDTFELLASKVKIESFSMFLIPLKTVISNSQNPKLMNKVEEVLKRLRCGICKNQSRDIKESLILIYNLINGKLEILKPLPDSSNAPKKSMYEETFTVQSLRRPENKISHDIYNQNSFRFVHFGLDILLWDIKKNIFNIRSEQDMAMLDPIVSSICECCYSKQSVLVALSVKILSLIVKFPLPSLSNAIPAVVKQIFRIIDSTGTSKTDIVQSCLRFLSAAIRASHYVEFKKKNIIALLSLLRPDLQDVSRHATTFSLIKAIISRKIVVEEVYDIMDDISQIMVTNQSTQIREQCRFTFLQFLLDYPQGKIRLSKQIHFFINNLSYEFESGRESVMEMLNVIILKVDASILQDYMDVMFVAFVMRLVNDDSSKCRELSGALIKQLIGKSNESQLLTIDNLAEKWYMQNGNQAIQRGGVQVLGFLLESVSKKMEKRAPSILTSIKTILHKLDSSLDCWELVYCSLNTLSKLYSIFPLMKYDAKFHDLWIQVKDLLLFPHVWVRLHACRLFGQYFADINTINSSIPNKSNFKDSLILNSPLLHQTAFQLCIQLESEYVTEDLSQQIVKNLLFISKCFFYIPECNKLSKVVEDPTQSDDDQEEEQPAERDTSSRIGFQWLLRKLSYKCRTEGTSGIQMRTASFRLFAALFATLPMEKLQKFTLMMLAPLYHVVNDSVTKIEGFENLRVLSQEVMQLIEKKVTTSVYSKFYEQVRKNADQRRVERRLKKSLMGVSDPVTMAKMKMKKNIQKTERKKRKIVEFNIGKGIKKAKQ